MTPLNSSQVGGSYEDTGMADITLAWIMAQLEEFLAFDTDYVAEQHDFNLRHYEKKKEKPRPWGTGKIYNSTKGITALVGENVRTPGQYFATDPKTGKATNRRLRETEESVHASVRVRKALKGLGREDKGLYNPPALLDYQLSGTPRQKNVQWEYKGKGGEPRILPEDKLKGLELQLLGLSPESYQVTTQG